MSEVQKADGANYAPQGKPNPVVRPGDFAIAAAFLDHGHINGQCNGLTEAGASLKWVYDPDPQKVVAFLALFQLAGSPQGANLFTLYMISQVLINLSGAVLLPMLRMGEFLPSTGVLPGAGKR